MPSTYQELKNIFSVNEWMEGMIYVINQRIQEIGKGREVRREAMDWRSWEDQGTKGQQGELRTSRIFNSSEEVKEKKIKGTMMRESI